MAGRYSITRTHNQQLGNFSEKLQLYVREQTPEKKKDSTCYYGVRMAQRLYLRYQKRPCTAHSRRYSDSLAIIFSEKNNLRHTSTRLMASQPSIFPGYVQKCGLLAQNTRFRSGKSSTPNAAHEFFPMIPILSLEL